MFDADSPYGVEGVNKADQRGKRNLSAEKTEKVGKLPLEGAMTSRFSRFIGLLSVLALAAVIAFPYPVQAITCGDDVSYFFIRNANGSYTETVYKVEFKGVSQVVAGDPDAGTMLNKWRWLYAVDAGFANSEYDVLVPACNTECDQSVVYTAGSNQVRDPGAGDGNTMYGVGDFQARVIALTPNQNSFLPGPGILFYTDKSSEPKGTSMQVKAGRTMYYIKNIKGPSCPDDTLIPASTSQVVSISGNSYTLVKNRWGCIKEVYQDGELLQTVQLDLADGSTQSGLLLCSPTDGRGGCNECIITTMGGSPHYTYFTINGVPYKSKPFCLSGETPSGTPISECLVSGQPHRH